MALNLTAFKSSLKDALKEAANDNRADGVTIDEAMGNLADAIASEVDAYIKTMTITLATGVVQVEGTAASQSNAAPIVVDGGVS